MLVILLRTYQGVCDVLTPGYSITLCRNRQKMYGAEEASAVALHASMSLQGLSACHNASPVAAGLYSPSLAMRLAHLCDTVVGLEAVRDDSDIVRLIPEPARYCLLLHPP